MGWLRRRREDDDPFRALREQPGYDAPASGDAVETLGTAPAPAHATAAAVAPGPVAYDDALLEATDDAVEASNADAVELGAARTGGRPSPLVAAVLIALAFAGVSLLVGVGTWAVSAVGDVVDRVQEAVDTAEEAAAPDPRIPSVRQERAPGPTMSGSMLRQPNVYAALRILGRRVLDDRRETYVNVIVRPDRVMAITVDEAGDRRVRTVTRTREVQALPSGNAAYVPGTGITSIDTGAPGRLVRAARRSLGGDAGVVETVVLVRPPGQAPQWTLTLAGGSPGPRTWIADEHGRGVRPA